MTSNPEKDLAPALDAPLEALRFVESMIDLCRAYKKENIDIQTRDWLLWRNVNEIPDLAQFSLYRRAKSYKDLKHIIEGSDVGTKTSKPNQVQSTGSANNYKFMKMYRVLIKMSSKVESYMSKRF